TKAPLEKVDVRHNNPLGLEEENLWTAWCCADLELRKTIRQDVQRTFPEVDYFRLTATQDRLTNLLFIWCKLHPSIGYRQGMHELLAPFLWVVDYDSLSPSPSSLPDKNSLPRLVLAGDSVEDDTWQLFAALMKAAQVYYDHQPSVALSPKPAPAFPPTASSSAPASGSSSALVQPIVSIAAHLQSLLSTVDPALHPAFTTHQVEPQLYLIRWLRLLFSREFPLPDTLTLWDGLFARDPSLQLTTHVALAMLLRIRDALVSAAKEGYGEFLHAVEGRSVRLWFEGVVSGKIDWRSGLPQGSPLSPALFLLFIAALLRRTTTTTTASFGWVDDVNIVAWGRTVEEATANLQAVVPEMEAWASQRGASFEPEKTSLTLFAPPNKILLQPLPTVVLNGKSLPYSPSLTMLGVEFDSSLSYRAHRAACAAKASTALAGVALLARLKAGLPPRRVKELVEALVMPRLLWCCAVWWKPGGEVSKVVEAVQREAARVVTGGFRTTSLVALEVEANLLPLPLHLDHHLFRLALRLHSSTPSHPLHKRFILARLAPAHPHQSAINRAMHSFPALLPPSTVVEPIYPDPVAPWARPPPVAIEMAESKEAGKLTHEAMEEALRGAEGAQVVVYSDVSLKEGMAGSGVTMRLWGEGEELGKVERRRGLGDFQTVHVAELEGVRQGLAAVSTLSSALPLTSIVTLLDNSAVVSHPFDPSPSPGQHLRLLIRNAFLALHRTFPAAALVVQWVPGHVGVEGNERADVLANTASDEARAERLALTQRAAAQARRKRGRGFFRREMMYEEEGDETDGNRSTDADYNGNQHLSTPTRAALDARQRPALSLRAYTTAPSPSSPDVVPDGGLLPKSLSALQQAHRAALLLEWERQWRASPTGASLRRVDPRPPGPAFSRLFSSLPRRHAVLLTRVRTNFVDLGARRFWLAEGDEGRMCERCGREETREHVVLECEAYEEARGELRRKVGRGAWTMALYLRDNLWRSGAEYVRRQNTSLGASVGEPQLDGVDELGSGFSSIVHPQGLGLFGKGLIGDLAKGVYGRAEALGLNKAITRAFNDIKRDFAEAQAQIKEQRRLRASGMSQIPPYLPWKAPSPAPPPPAAKDALSDLAKMRASSIATSAAIDLCVAVLERELVPPKPDLG
ncbi:hypothetical protein JCM6882_006886, partial [Rhodosporidiobolus microsporus]